MTKSRDEYRWNKEGRSDVDISMRTKEGILWTSFFQGIQFIIQFAGSVILARILFPEDFGLMGIASIVIQFARRLANFGFTTVLVQRKEIQREHFETVFIVNLLLMGAISISLFFLADYIGLFFNNWKVSPVVMVLGLDFIVQACKSIPISMLRRRMRFKEAEKAETIGTFLRIMSPIGFAIAGMGVWSLVIGHLAGSISGTIMAAYYAKWVPRFRFNFWALRDVFAFGMWIYVDSYITYGIKKVDFFTVAKFVGVAELGFYERAFNLMSLPRRQIALKINKVLLSTYSRIQNDREKSVRALLRVITLFSLIMYPLMTWMYFAAPAVIMIIYGSKWQACIGPLQIMCLAGVFNTFAVIISELILAQGLVRNRARRNFFYFVILALSVSVGARWGIKGVAWGTTVASIFQLALILHLAIQHLPVSLKKFFYAQKSAMCYAILQAFALIQLQNLGKTFIAVDSWQMLVGSIFVSATGVIVSHYMFKFKDIRSILEETFSSFKQADMMFMVKKSRKAFE